MRDFFRSSPSVGRRMIFFLCPQTDRRGTKQRQMQSFTEGKLLRTEGLVALCGLVPEPAGSHKELPPDPSSYTLSVSKTLANNCSAAAPLEKVNTFILHLMCRRDSPTSLARFGHEGPKQVHDGKDPNLRLKLPETWSEFVNV